EPYLYVTPSPPHAYSPFVFLIHATRTAALYTLSLHDALPIYVPADGGVRTEERAQHGRVEQHHRTRAAGEHEGVVEHRDRAGHRSEEHTSELQSPYDLVCRLLLEKKKKNIDSKRTG